MPTDTKHGVISGLQAIGALSAAYLRSTQILIEGTIVKQGVHLKFRHTRLPDAASTWEIIPWDAVSSAEDFEAMIVDKCMLHTTTILEKASLPVPMIRPFKAKPVPTANA